MYTQEDCARYRKQIEDLKSLHASYLDTYKEALANKEASPENAFSECKSLKEKLKKGIQKLQEKLNILSKKQKQQLAKLKSRFQENPERHKDLIDAEISWDDIARQLRRQPKLVDSLIKMEETGGEPDAIWLDPHLGYCYFVDCSAESPAGRMHLCYDARAQASAEDEGHHPEGNAKDMAEDMGIQILTEKQYKLLHGYGTFDQTTSSMISTPIGIRKGMEFLIGRWRDNTIYIRLLRDSLPYLKTGFRGALQVPGFQRGLTF